MPERIELVPIADVRVGDTIWVQQDNDWLTVHRVKLDDPYAQGPLFFRNDGSEAEFRPADRVPRRTSV